MLGSDRCTQAAKKQGKHKEKHKHQHREHHKHEHHRGDRKRSRADRGDSPQQQGPKRVAMSLAEACAPRSRAAAADDNGPPGLDIGNGHAAGATVAHKGRHAPKEVPRTGQHIRF